MAIEVPLANIETKPSDFKVCKKCGSLNWYENESCFNCGAEEFDESEEAVWKWVSDEREYWIKEEGYSDEEADTICITTN